VTWVGYRNFIRAKEKNFMRRPSNDDLKKWYGLAKAATPNADKSADPQPSALPAKRAERKRFRPKNPRRLQVKTQQVADEADQKGRERKQCAVPRRGSGLLGISATEEFKSESTLIPKRD
jgi:hypothetical protein